MARQQRQLEILVDRRERRPWTFGPEVEKGEVVLIHESIATGDYAVRGMAGLAAVERKDAADAWKCCGTDRARFRRQMERLGQLRWPLLLIEGTIAELAAHPVRGGYRRRLTAASVIGTLVSWSAELGVPWLAGGSVRQCERLAFIHLRAAARLRARELGRLGHE